MEIISPISLNFLHDGKTSFPRLAVMENSHGKKYDKGKFMRLEETQFLVNFTRIKMKLFGCNLKGLVASMALRTASMNMRNKLLPMFSATSLLHSHATSFGYSLYPLLLIRWDSDICFFISESFIQAFNWFALLENFLQNQTSFDRSDSKCDVKEVWVFESVMEILCELLYKILKCLELVWWLWW